MLVTRDDAFDLAALFEYSAHGVCVLHDMLPFGGIFQPLMAKYDHVAFRRSKFLLKPGKLFRRHVRIVPWIVAAVRLQLRIEAGVEHDKLDATSNERIIPLRDDTPVIWDVLEEFSVRQTVEIVVTGHMVARTAKLRETRLNRIKALERTLAIAGKILEVSKLDSEIQRTGVEHLYRLAKLSQGFAIEPAANHAARRRIGIDVGIMEVGHHAEAYYRHGTFVGAAEKMPPGKDACCRRNYECPARYVHGKAVLCGYQALPTLPKSLIFSSMHLRM